MSHARICFLRASVRVDLDSLPLTLTVEQTAKLMGLSRGSAYEAVRTGQIPSLRIGRRVLIPKHALLQLLGVTGAEDAHPQDGHARRDPGGPQHSQEDERDSGERVGVGQ